MCFVRGTDTGVKFRANRNQDSFDAGHVGELHRRPAEVVEDGAVEVERELAGCMRAVPIHKFTLSRCDVGQRQLQAIACR